MWELVRELRATGVTIILTTHYIEEAEEMADRVGVIRKGELVARRSRPWRSVGDGLFDVRRQDTDLQRPGDSRHARTTAARAKPATASPTISARIFSALIPNVSPRLTHPRGHPMLRPHLRHLDSSMPRSDAHWPMPSGPARATRPRPARS